MTVLDLYIGVGSVATTREERQLLAAVLDSYPVVDVTPRIARRAGRLRGENMAADEDEGPGTGKGDAAIAATALVGDEPVLAGDSHFEELSGVAVETYRQS